MIISASARLATRISELFTVINENWRSWSTYKAGVTIAEIFFFSSSEREQIIILEIKEAQFLIFLDPS